MPITNVNRSGNDSSSNRTTFRPPWVKSAGEPTPAPTQPSWVKKKSSDAGPSSSVSASTPSSSSSAVTKPATTTTQSKQNSTPSKTTTINSSKSSEPTTSATKEAPKKTTIISKNPTTAPAKKEIVPSPMNTPQKEVRLQSREVKVPVMSERRQSEQHAPLKPVLKKAPPPPSSSEEEESDVEEEEYTEEEVSEEEEAEQDDEMAEMERLIEEARKEAAKKSRDERMKKEISEKTKADKLMVKLKPVLKKTPTIEEMPKEKPKSFLEKPTLRKVEKKVDQILEKPAKPKLEMPTLKKVVKKDSPVTVKAEPEWKNEAVLQPVKNVPPPPPPPLNGAPPPPPPPPGMTAAEKKALTDKQRHTLDKLKSRPRRRPDWSEMMAEVEQGRKLKHVQCNDRSQPILTTKSMAKVDGQFVFETEKEEKKSDHNQLLKQIQFGIKLKPTKTNDRSRPDLAGLRKFRRQMTIEEQIKKSESRATMPPDAPAEEDEEDEMDDIDRLRDDLQSTKQMLSQELRNKEAQERENKRLLAKIQNLEAELEREKCKGGAGESMSATTGATSASSGTKADEALVKALKQEAAESQKISKDLEKKYNAISEQLDSAKNDIEEKNRKIAALEKQLSQVAALWDSGDEDQDSNYHLQRARSKGPGGYGNRRQSEAIQRDSSPEPEPEVSESDEEEDEGKKAERKKRRAVREVKLMRHKLTRLKEKEMVAKQEREALKMVMRTQQLIMKEEKKKYKALQKEVSKMAKLMAEEADDDDDDDEEKPEEPEKEESEDSAAESEESESDDSGSEEESESESEAEDAEEDAKKTNLDPRVKRHEGILAALKKSNLLHQANVDKIKDEINIQRDLSDQLQHDLDSVLSELG